MIKTGTCSNCAKSFTYKTGDSSGKFCTRQCWREGVAASRVSKLLITKTGSLRHAYPIICVICGAQKFASSREVTHCSQKCEAETFARNRKYKVVVINGRRETRYPIVCANCGSEKDAVRKTAKYCSSSCQLQYEYKNGTRDKSSIAAAAHEAVRKNGQPKMRGVKRGSPPQEVCDKISATKFARHKEFREAHGLPEPKLAQELRGSRKWREWRLAVYERDNYTCVFCGDDRGGNLEADHIKPRLLYPELTFEVSNGRTLCKSCHKNTPTYGQRVKTLYSARSYIVIALLHLASNSDICPSSHYALERHD